MSREAGKAYDAAMEIATHIVNLNAEALPRCFVLDENHRIIMVCSAQSGQPLNPQFSVEGDFAKLPSVLERAVSVLAARCVLERTLSKSAKLGAYHVKVQLLRGSRKTHKAVIVDRAEAA
ncbi:MAG: hypothetical protein JO322_06250 [Candidatus Eremiobacteraeota bacterium]|nr:hypothetical protein [Candidatus Eremiobacteraeota bacterium]